MGKKYGMMMLALACIFITNSYAELRLPNVLSSHMVLQRNKPIAIWGWADPRERVSVTLDGEDQRVRVNEAGEWHVDFPAMEAGGPYDIRIKGSSEIVLKDVLIGDVWICSGQSNMKWPLKNSDDCKDVIFLANNPNLRILNVARTMQATPESDVKTSSWMIVTPETVANFSAVAYSFGQDVQTHLGIPVGLIGASWGGTMIETWMSKESLAPLQLIDDIDSIVPKRHPNSYKTVLFNGMIHPLLKLQAKGVIWDQGESDARENPEGYAQLFAAMVNDWRARWLNSELPFISVQLPNYKRKDHVPPKQSNWALLREAQAKTLKIPYTGMAVIIDLGEASNIHSGNKKIVGHRLMRSALKVAYGETDLNEGPILRSWEIKGNQVKLYFDQVGAGLRSGNKYGYLQGFQIAGDDQEFHWATAMFGKDQVVLYSAKVNVPVAVRYAWGNNPEADLFNSENLPASPFRTDDW